MKPFTAILFLISILFAKFMFSGAGDTIEPTQSIGDGETIVSAGGIFELGFFSPKNSANKYVGIWYKNMTQTVVWVANRETPLADSTGVLTFTAQGTLILQNRSKTNFWFSNSSTSASHNSPIAKLLDTGNFVVRDRTIGDDDPEKFAWQSFDYGCDTLLPGMRLGRNIITGQVWLISSWKSPDDPAHGNYSAGLDPHRYLQLLVLAKDSTPFAMTGPWNGAGFSGAPEIKENPYFKFSVVQKPEEIYYTYTLLNKALLTRLVLTPTGLLQRFMWAENTQGWKEYLSVSLDNCFRYKACGAFGTCNVNNLPICRCLRGFQPKQPSDWARTDWSSGCTRSMPLGCERPGDWFMKYSGVKLPDTIRYWENGSMSLGECEAVCLRNCSCTAYADSDVRNGGSGCLMWFGELVDIRETNDNGQDVYIRLAASELGKANSTNTKPGKANSTNTKPEPRENKRVKIVVISIVALAILLLSLPLVFCVFKKSLRRQKAELAGPNADNLELPLFDLGTIAKATDNFSVHNKLGEGGFGPVYKGLLEDGQEVAVKRLSKSSKQGLDEFKNEVVHIAKLQHRNLVRLLGCCIEGEEKLLVYEYMPNNSLDYFIFGHIRDVVLDWPTRYQIIHGIARGLLYLHQDSRLRIIHRDLKAGNVLLDNEMNPKISDFGLARSFGGNEIQANTKRVVGTYGYMSPEYAIDGLYSIKSDVFSFGVLVLEIVSGRRNRGFVHQEHNLNLLGHAWTLHKESRPLELVDESLNGVYDSNEVLRSIQLGLLCVQRNPDDRPNMPSVVLILGGEGKLAAPKQPGFFTERDIRGETSSSSNQELCSANEMSVTLLEAR